jgi:hypothetical protein
MANFYSTLLDDILPSLPSCENAMALFALKRAAQEFMKKTQCDQRVIAPSIAVTAGNAAYAVPVPANTELVTVTKLALDGTELRPVPRDWLTEEMETLAGTPSHFVVGLDGTVTLWKKPTAGGTLTGKIAVAPLPTATDILDPIANAFSEDIAAGALSRLMLMPNKPWTQVELSVAHRSRFDNAIDRAKYEVAKGRSRSAMQSDLWTIGGR